MPSRWVPLAAEVEWFEGHRGRERPEALRSGAGRLVLTVEASWAVGPDVAGQAERRVFLVRAADGRRLRIRLNGQGHVAVEAEVPE
jgi:hypothetical protein